MTTVTIKPTDAAIRNYQKSLADLTAQGVRNEGGLRTAFASLLRDTSRKRKWNLVEELPVSGGRLRPDGTLRDSWQLPHGYWEAKDAGDDLEVEIRNKRDVGYPFSNTIFENTQSAVLFQNERRILTADCNDRKGLAELLTRFYRHETPDFSSFEEAVERFSDEVPQLAKGLQDKIDEARLHNRPFQDAFADFMTLCREALNPNISREAVEEMLIQHLLTERLIRRVFDQENFVRRNVIAAEVEKVIDALTGQHFNRREFLGSLDRFYRAIEGAADRLADFSDKQRFINTIYERFFQGFSVKVADTHGIVYTPQEVVEFMVAATDELLQREFGKKLGDEGVCVIDPCTGTGNFVVQLLRRVARENRPQLDAFYRERLFANEVMLMPYYIASLNIEHEYHKTSGRYESFEGLCFVDTLDLAEGDMPEMFPEFSQRNSARVERQKAAKINVVIGNPPYNVGQLNENDNNKNRKYEVVDSRVRESYGFNSLATNKNKLYDPYVKFFRWASDRLGDDDGLVCFITNNNFIDGTALDGMRRELLCDFTGVYHLDLHGNVRVNPKISGTSHNVFGIQVGVGITLAVQNTEKESTGLSYHRLPEMMRKEGKLAFLAESVSKSDSVLNTVDWRELLPDKRHTWLHARNADEFASFFPLGTKEVKLNVKNEFKAVFKTFSNGISTNRDSVVFDFDHHKLLLRIGNFVDDYNAEVDRYRRYGRPIDVDGFVKYEGIKWSSALKDSLRRLRYVEHSTHKYRMAQYRPFSKRDLYFDHVLIHRRFLMHQFFPTCESERDNQIIALAGVGHRTGFGSLVSKQIIPMDFAFEKAQCFPLYTYDPDGTNRRENVTDWALATFRDNYGDQSIEKLDIFHYVYGLLHHPGYRERHADSLRRELPRIPLAPDFHAFRDAGRELARLHLNYEREQVWRLDWEYDPERPLHYRVEKMRPLKRVQSEDGDYRIFDSLEYNDTLTLRGIPAEAFRYRLGTRSALEWIIDQYRVKTDKRSGIVSDPNAWSTDLSPDRQSGGDEQYIVNLVGRVITVSVETVKIVDGLAGLKLLEG